MLTVEKKGFITLMAESDVLRFGNFITKSGRESPYFINTGNFRTGRQLAALGKFYAGLVHETVGEDFSALFGPAYKGIPLAAACASALWEQYQIDRPYFFNRKEEKDHGEGGSIIGYRPAEGDRIVIIEDVITAGTTIREVVPLLRGLGNIQVTDIFMSVDRMEYGQNPGMTAVTEVAGEYGIAVHAIATVDDIREWLAETECNPDDLRRMDEYREKYCVRK
jgi:orotate phosphoribosyltransferase